ncbi:tRNA delta(2)-isopentenylpyrophosphate transferase [Hyphomicrobium methylovorum]|uniref:DUF1194 domain-containing protein n=1 Tax=Hyphomicrobium methylovorum TaxID=84 RepID=UPI0015E69959|nr:tRNA delta(2)-isopentenylpyrophosphate transferase [Hyphomicrobium methylovorum]
MAASLFAAPQTMAQDTAPVDTALVVSVDVSNSVDEARYKLQMEGIAKALEDPAVIDAMTGGGAGGILFSMVTWADKPAFALPWIRIATKADALAAAQRVRNLPHQGGEFTCMTRMLRSVNDKIVPQIPAKASRIIVDVSGDGPDNCNADEPIEAVRDELVKNGVTINGLPVLLDTPEIGPLLGKAEPGGPHPLETWYRQHVMAGAGSFVLPAQGYGDFERAIRQKFVIEVSGVEAPAKHKQADIALGLIP